MKHFRWGKQMFEHNGFYSNTYTSKQFSCGFFSIIHALKLWKFQIKKTMSAVNRCFVSHGFWPSKFTVEKRLSQQSGSGIVFFKSTFTVIYGCILFKTFWYSCKLAMKIKLHWCQNDNGKPVYGSIRNLLFTFLIKLFLSRVNIHQPLKISLFTLKRVKISKE